MSATARRLGFPAGSPERIDRARSDPREVRASADPGPLRILVIADAKITVPPAGYGGTERIVALLCACLAARGHEVTLMAAKGSRNYGRPITHPWAGCKPYPYRAWCKLRFQALSLWHARNADLVIDSGRVDYLGSLLRTSTPLICRFDNPIEQSPIDFLLARRREALALVSVSDHQRPHLADTGPWRTIYNAVHTDGLAFAPRREPGYLAFLGRLTPDKGVHVAIEVARRLGRPLRIAGNVSDEAGARRFFETRVRPNLGAGIEWVGPVDDDAKVPFLQNAAALLMPIQWDEPFGLVVAEALACGTPVLAMRRGSMPEIIHDGITGSCVVRRGLDCEVWLIGEDNRRRELEALITAEGLGDRVHLLGMRRDVPELVGQLDLFVFATTSDEGLGIALIEAMAVGVPVVASDVGACREVLDDGALGLLVPPGGPVALADAIERVRDHPETAAARVERARRKAFEVFDAERMAAAYADVLGLGAVGAGSALQAA